MSKKLAAGADAMVLDVKSGVGAFMQTLEEARALATIMTAIGKHSGRKVVCLLSDMNQPLGIQVGNALELREAIETLKGEGPQDFLEHCLVVASHMLVLGKKADSLSSARNMAENALKDGSALAKFRQLVIAQEGDVRYADDLGLLQKADIVEIVSAPTTGFLHSINAREIGESAVDLGAGRMTKQDKIDPAVGISVLHKVGDHVIVGEPLFILHANDRAIADAALERIVKAHVIKEEKCEPLPLFYGVIE
jgi:pyrimidine-nucleoside phosphorylase